MDGGNPHREARASRCPRSEIRAQADGYRGSRRVTLG